MPQGSSAVRPTNGLYLLPFRDWTKDRHSCLYPSRRKRIFSFFGLYWLGSEVNHSPECIAKVKNEWSCTSAPHRCLHGVNRDNFAFKGKNKAVPLHSMKAHRGRMGTAPLILKLGSMNSKLCRPQSWSGCFGDVKDLLLLPGIEPWIIQPVACSVDHLYSSDASLILLVIMRMVEMGPKFTRNIWLERL